MSAIPGPFNPIAYVQFNLQGRWRRLLTFTFIYLVVVGGIIWMTSLDENSARQMQTIRNWLTGLLTLQGLNLLLFGSFRVESAVRLDVTSRMIESHRLMPCSPLGNILGYIFGAPLQSFLILLANFLLGIACCMAINRSLDDWVLVNAFFLEFALLSYCIIVQHALLARGAYVILIFVSLVMLLAPAGSPLASIGSLSVLFAPFYGRSAVAYRLYGWSSAATDVWYAYFWSLLGQACIAVICLRIAVRRYTTANTIGLSAKLALLLLTTWVGLEMVYVSADTAFQRSQRYSYYASDEEQLPTALVTTLLLTLFPLASAARETANLRSTDPKAKHSSKLNIVQTAFLEVLIIVFLGACLLPKFTEHISGQMLITTAIVIFSFILGNASLFSWGYRVMKRAWVYVLLWLVLTWVTPLIVDAVQRSMAPYPYRSKGADLFSPAGAIYQIWSRRPAGVWVAVTTQLLASLVPFALAITRFRKRVKTVMP